MQAGDLRKLLAELKLVPDELAVVVVDHGSKRDESNHLLLRVVALFQQLTGYAVVEPAHMELAEPSIATAFRRCVERGAKLIVVHPYFLLPGRHWDKDIPELAAQAARQHQGLRYLVTAPLGLHPLMTEIMDQRIRHCLEHISGRAGPCEACSGSDRCQLRP